MYSCVISHLVCYYMFSMVAVCVLCSDVDKALGRSLYEQLVVAGHKKLLIRSQLIGSGR